MFILIPEANYFIDLLIWSSYKNYETFPIYSVLLSLEWQTNKQTVHHGSNHHQIVQWELEALF